MTEFRCFIQRSNNRVKKQWFKTMKRKDEKNGYKKS